MKQLSILLLAIFVCCSTFGQTSKNVIITKTPKTVPYGKKWILEAGQVTRVQVSPDVLRSGSLCNAIFRSSLRRTASVNRGDIFNAEIYMIIFKDPEKVPYTNDYTYDLTIVSILDKNYAYTDLSDKKPENIGIKKIEFKAGESVYVSQCLGSIELKEINMTKAELQEVKIKEDKINTANNLKLSNFQIPVKPEKYVEPGTKPEIYDIKLKRIVFSSLAVLYRHPEKGLVLDDVSTWTLSLTADEFNLSSSNGIDKTYSVIKIEYNEKMKMQNFVLGNSNNEITHNLLISWSNSSNHYSLILNSTDYTEGYQFQEVESTDKQYQNE